MNRIQDLERPNLAIILSFYSQLGDEWELKPEVQEQLEAFTCVMYSHARETSVDLVRSKMLRKMVGEDEALSSRSRVDFARMPPCQDALIPHIQRVNYRVASYKRAAEPIFWRPKPYDEGQGWQKTEGGIVEPISSCGPILPQSLIDLLAAGANGDGDGDEREEDEVEFDDDMDDTAR